LHLPAAFKAYPGRGTVIYNRVSSREQAGRGRVKLDEKTLALFREVRRLAPERRRWALIGAIEPGKLLDPDSRPELLRATDRAEERGAILVAWDPNRFLRAAAYDHETNRNARPTPDDFQMLHELTRGVPLATVMSPHLTERDLHSLATKKTGKAGRPREVTSELEAEINRRLEAFVVERSGRYRWIPSLREVARQLGLSVATVQRYANVEEGIRKAEVAGLWYPEYIRAPAATDEEDWDRGPSLTFEEWMEMNDEYWERLAARWRM
jgi:DNA invertase Pin-like site-specific DNA recombinase